MGRIVSLTLIFVFSIQAWADDALWGKLKTEPGLIVFLRNADAAGGSPLMWDRSGNCKGEATLTAEGVAHAKKIGKAFASRGIRATVISSPMCRARDTATIAFGETLITDEALRDIGIASADAEQVRLFERKAQALIADRRGPTPVVFVSHRPNIDRLTMELIDAGELLVGRVSAKGEIDVLGKIKID
jgi:phosphohistidine phosphatase SixA